MDPFLFFCICDGILRLVDSTVMMGSCLHTLMAVAGLIVPAMNVVETL